LRRGALLGLGAALDAEAGRLPALLGDLEGLADHLLLGELRLRHRRAADLVAGRRVLVAGFERSERRELDRELPLSWVEDLDVDRLGPGRERVGRLLVERAPERR